MKKFSKLFVLPVAMLTLAACGNGGDEGNGDTDGEDTDATTGATEVYVDSEETLLDGISEDGPWIIIFEEDFETEEDLVLTGDVEGHSGELERKLALYTQDEDRNITDQFTLTAPSLTIQSENARIQGGTFAGDVVVEADGFSMPDGTIDGNLTFTSAEFEESADLSEGTVTGEVSVDE